MFCVENLYVEVNVCNYDPTLCIVQKQVISVTEAHSSYYKTLYHQYKIEDVKQLHNDSLRL